MPMFLLMCNSLHRLQSDSEEITVTVRRLQSDSEERERGTWKWGSGMGNGEVCGVTIVLEGGKATRKENLRMLI